MASMQNVRFREIGELLEFLPPDELQLLQILREIIIETCPGVRERLSFSVPFYKITSDICFLWPSSVLWGAKKTIHGVRMGFSRGNELRATHEGLLEIGTRRFVAYKDFRTLQDIDEKQVIDILIEACSLDTLHKNSRRKVRK